MKENLNSGYNEEEMYNPNLRVVDLPKSSTENMFVLIGGGGNPDDYDANGKWLGGGGPIDKLLELIQTLKQNPSAYGKELLLGQNPVKLKRKLKI